MLIGFVIWSVVAIIFLCIGLSSWRAKEPVGFFTGVKPTKMKDTIAYNRAVAKIWFVFAGVLEIWGIPLLFVQQNSPIVFLVVMAVVGLVIATMMVYVRVEANYRE